MFKEKQNKIIEQKLKLRILAHMIHDVESRTNRTERQIISDMTLITIYREHLKHVDEYLQELIQEYADMRRISYNEAVRKLKLETY